MGKRLYLVLLVIGILLLFSGCHQRNYSKGEVVEYVQYKYGVEYSLRESNKQGSKFYFYNEEEEFGFQVSQERSDIYFDASVIGSKPVLISDYVKNKYNLSQQDIDKFIEENNLYVEISESSRYITYYMFSNRNSMAEFMGLVYYLKECIGDRDTSYGNIDESLKIHAYYKEPLTEELLYDRGI